MSDDMFYANEFARNADDVDSDDIEDNDDKNDEQ